jgi:hypothetical protein
MLFEMSKVCNFFLSPRCSKDGSTDTDADTRRGEPNKGY